MEAINLTPTKAHGRSRGRSSDQSCGSFDGSVRTSPKYPHEESVGEALVEAVSMGVMEFHRPCVEVMEAPMDVR